MSEPWKERCYLAPSGCWVWTGGTNSKGYGTVRLGGRSFLVHRMAYIADKGAIPDGYQIDHLCRNKRCANPGHLQAVTPRVNTMRGMTSARRFAERTHCAKGHPLDQVIHRRLKTVRRCSTCHNERERARYRERVNV